MTRLAGIRWQSAHLESIAVATKQTELALMTGLSLLVLLFWAREKNSAVSGT